MPKSEFHGDTLDFQASNPSERLDVFLSREAGIGTRSYAAKLVKDGFVSVNGKPAKAAQAISAGDFVRVFVASSPPPRAEDLPLTVLYEDEDILVVDKPAGMVVHPAPGHPEHTLVNALLARHPELGGIDAVRPGIVHRLDKDTSGLMVVALNAGSREWLIAQFKTGAVHKEYLALVAGQPDDCGVIEGPIGRHPIHRKRMAVVPGGKPAVTRFTVVERLGAFALVLAQPVTGRTHQLRVHLHHVGHPIAGDRVYGGRHWWRPLEDMLPRHFLHAALLSFRPPHSSNAATFSSQLPPDLQQALETARRIAA